MDYRKVAKRLVKYKVSKGNYLPYFQKYNPGIKEDSSGRVYYLPIDNQLEKEILVNRLEFLVSMRHSKIGVVRKLSRKDLFFKK